jgi:hypothetical protein
MAKLKVGGFGWGLPLCGALGGVILTLPKMIDGNGVGAFFATLVLATLIGFVMLVVAVMKVRRNSRAVLAMVCLFIVLAWALFKSSDDLRETASWLL